MCKAKVYWVTGLSGAGKTTVSHLLLDKLRSSGEVVIFLDGDILRDVLNATSAHSKDERRELAMTYSRICRMLVEQGVNVVCATISMFNSVRQWNRKNIKGYIEVYLDVPIDILIKRDQKSLYSMALQGKVENVMGINSTFEAPENADIVIHNDGGKSPEQVTKEIFNKLELLIREN